MTGWNFDISSAPKSYLSTETRIVRGKPQDVQVLIDIPIVLATKCKRVFKTRWLPAKPKDKNGYTDRPVGRWEFLGTKEQPIAWRPWFTHPYDKVKDDTVPSGSEDAKPDPAAANAGGVHVESPDNPSETGKAGAGTNTAPANLSVPRHVHRNISTLEAS